MYLSAKNFKSTGLDLSNVDYISEGDYEKHFGITKKALTTPVKGDVLFGIIGSLGTPYSIKNKDRFGLSSSVAILRPNKDLCPDYLYHFMTSSAFQSAVHAIKSGAAQGFLSLEMVKNLPLVTHEINVQRKVAAILSAYDELIENNQRRIALLEKMAEEIYREWFVRMRFPDHENAKSSKGLPSDWDTKRVKEIVDRKGFGRIYREDELSGEGQVIVIDQSRSDCLGYYDGEPQHIASPDFPIILFGDHSCKMILMTKPFSLAENVIPFMPKPKVSPYFLFHLVKDLARTTEYKRHWTDLTNREVLFPKESLQVEFENVVKYNHEQIEVLQQAIRKAEKVRNMLLPRLISGKLSVENLDIQFPPGMEEG